MCNLVKCPLCSKLSFDNGVHEVPVATFIVGHRGVLFSNATWRNRPKYVRCPLCVGKGKITRELATAWALIDTEEYALPTYSEVLCLRRAVSPRSLSRLR